MQAFNANRFDQAARFFGLIADEKEPRATPKETWRYLGKSLLAAGKPAEALPAIDRALEVEDAAGWKADGLLDRAKAYLALGKTDDSMKACEEGQALRPVGRVNSELRMVKGDIYMKRNDPAQAAGEYVVVVQLLDENDKVLRPLAMWKLIKALEAQGKKAEADEYGRQLETKYPGWKPPAP